MKVIVGADHNGFFLKNDIVKYLKGRKVPAVDAGPAAFDKDDDYPVYARKVAEAVAKDPESRGIIVCGSGTGVAIAANKVKGIRAAELTTEDAVYLGRSHNNINVLCLNGLDFTGFYKKLSKMKGEKVLMDLKPKKISLIKVKKLIDIFLTTKFEGGRHQRRLDMISDMEH
ncbi:RpiB/LacA/LacB family sugar-phosphate isomerase [Candidatus Woesearchaeota archaeon]|nr:RpiB/LacA/LacB family sugar-phosphate isomerase [Candidatus Woesearchaeota archaeon]